MAEHTPGPWAYEPDGDFYNAPDGRAYVDVSAGAPVDAPSRYVEVATGLTAKADAALIAAAPDLLDALYAIRKGFDDGSIKFTKRRQADSEPYHPANVKMCAAIAKAEGRE